MNFFLLQVHRLDTTNSMAICDPLYVYLIMKEYISHDPTTTLFKLPEKVSQVMIKYLLLLGV